MDAVNFVLTFGPASLIVYSLGKRLVMAGRAQRSAAPRPASVDPVVRTLPIRRWYRVAHGPVVDPRVMSRAASGVSNDRPLHAAESGTTTMLEESNNGIATPTMDRNALLRETARCLAIVVNDRQLGETEGIRKFFGCAPSSSNPKYLTARSLLKEELEKLRTPYPNRTEDQAEKRKELELETTPSPRARKVTSSA
jgi:hypothetical protein